MKAMVMRGVGGPEVLELAEMPRPKAAVGEILVKVKAVGVNPIDYKLRQSGAFGAGAGTVLGFDVAGVVEQVGLGGTYFKAGDEVWYSPEFGAGGIKGAYAEYHVVREAVVDFKPKTMSFEEAAAIPLSGMTAWEGVMERGKVGLGDTVLVAAANGGVGSIAVQLCKAAGAYVFGTCSTRSLAFVEELGVDRAVNYQEGDWAAVVAGELKGMGIEGLDLVYDGAGKDVVSRTLPLVRGFGNVVTIVNPSGSWAEGYRRNVTVHFEFMVRRREVLEKLRRLVERGQLEAHVERVMKLEEAGEAHRRLEAGGVQGKVVLGVGGG